MKKIILFFIIIIILFVAFRKLDSRSFSAEELGIEELSSSFDADGDGIDDWHDIMLGAREYIETKPKYKSSYYEGGYPNDGYGVCTDVVWNAFAAAGYDLKAMVDSHIAENQELYTDMESPDPNIDFRRVRNLKYFLKTMPNVLIRTFPHPKTGRAEI